MPVKSRTYKLKVTGEQEQTIYFTIVGDDVPESFFINSKEMNSFQWIIALMTSYSRQVRLDRDVMKVVADMKSTFDPNGRYFLSDGTGREVYSIVHHLGLVLEEHMNDVVNRKKLLKYYKEGIAQGLNHLDATTYAESVLADPYFKEE